LTLIGLEGVVATASGLSEAVAWEFSRFLVEAVGEMLVNRY
jgi:glutathione peroxidase-family protein